MIVFLATATPRGPFRCLERARALRCRARPCFSRRSASTRPRHRPDRHFKCGWRAVPHSAVSFRNRAHELCERLKRSLFGVAEVSLDELAEALVIQADVPGIAVGVGDERGVLAVEAPGRSKCALAW